MKNNFKYGFRLNVKNFEYDNNIFSDSKKIWDLYKNGRYAYKLDGLIYTPKNDAVNIKFDKERLYEDTLHLKNTINRLKE